MGSGTERPLYQATCFASNNLFCIPQQPLQAISQMHLRVSTLIDICHFERRNILFSDCSLKHHMDYHSDQYMEPYPVKQPNGYACRKHCDLRTAPYFKYRDEKCYCTRTMGGQKRQFSTYSVLAKGCGGGM